MWTSLQVMHGVVTDNITRLVEGHHFPLSLYPFPSRISTALIADSVIRESMPCGPAMTLFVVV